MTKSVFLGMATISHGTLEDLGDKEALTQIREKLISLSDSGDSQSSTETAMKWLSGRIATIGQPTARTKPLPMTRARLVDLQKESEQLRAVRREVDGLEEERLAVLQEIDRLIQRRMTLETQLSVLEKNERAERLQRILKLKRRLDEVTKECFSLSAARDFPLTNVNDVQRAATMAGTSEQQLERTRAEKVSLQQQIDKELQRAGDSPPVSTDEGDPEYESKLAELQSAIQLMRERLDEAENAKIAAEERCAEAQNNLAGLPDFTLLSSDPVEWLTQLSSSFSVAQRTRDSETSQLERVVQAVESKRDDLKETQDVFADCDNFLDLLAHYESTTQESETSVRDLQLKVDILREEADELNSRVPGFTITAVLSLGLMGLLIGAALYTGNPGIYIPAGIAALMVIFFSINVFGSRYGADKRLRRLHLVQHDKDNALRDTIESRGSIDVLMLKSRCQTVRELEALYEKYMHDKTELSLLEDQRHEQESRAKEASERVLGMHERLRATFLRIGEKLENEEDIHGAAMRSIARYQEYRDAKRRASEQREIADRRRKEIESLAQSLETATKKELSLSLEVRQLLRNNDFLEESKCENALEALRAYKLRNAKYRRSNSDVDILRGKLAVVDQQIETEQTTFTEQQEILESHLGRARVASPDEFMERADQAQVYEKRRQEMSGLEEQITALLGDDDIGDLKQVVESDGPIQESGTRRPEELKVELKDVQEAVDTKQSQAHALHIEITERCGGMRSVNEVDEERDTAERTVQELELELQSASYAMSVLDEVTRERHSQIAPVLAERASAYLSEITDGAYNELLVNRDMGVSVRIPETKVLNDDPERGLSKGTVDQIFLSLRLAMVQSSSESDERVPMLLDDPFANYDDARLARAMKLLHKVGQTNQILFFTCRQDVIKAGQMVGAPVINL